MNKAEKKKLSDSFNEWKSSLTDATDKFRDFLDIMTEAEQTKLDSIPESLHNSPLYEQIGLCIESLSETIDTLDKIPDAIDEVDLSIPMD